MCDHVEEVDAHTDCGNRPSAEHGPQPPDEANTYYSIIPRVQLGSLGGQENPLRYVAILFETEDGRSDGFDGSTPNRARMTVTLMIILARYEFLVS